MLKCEGEVYSCFNCFMGCNDVILFHDCESFGLEDDGSVIFSIVVVAGRCVVLGRVDHFVERESNDST